MRRIAAALLLVIAAAGLGEDARAGLDAASLAADLLKARPAPTPLAPQAPSAPQAPMIRLGRTLSSGATRVETLALDDYIAQVISGEGQPKASDSAQEALAITARTFALANRNRHRSEGFDLCDTTHCQVVRPATTITRKAAAVTSGRVLLHQGRPAFVFYSAWCGGHTELASQVWPGAVDYPLGESLEDEACEGEPPWTSEVRAGEIERALRAAGLRGSRLRDLRVLARNDSERVARIRVEGFTPSEMSGHEFRMAVGRVAGWQSIKSTAFDVDRTGTGYRFRGRGFGHGVGLCVVGAGTRANRGASADDILRFYFPGLTIGSAFAATESASARASASARETPGELRRDRAGGEVLLALPGAAERERAALMSLVVRSRDEIAKATGVTTALTLRVTVHPTVDSFGRATGQPWWVSGATEGSSIDLLPLWVLRQQGQLDRTVRHEVAHALLDDALAKRPVWVREGAAAYFASPATARQGRPDRVPCPSDLELLRPISAGAQRDAYARAEACFAREVADGKRWNEIR